LVVNTSMAHREVERTDINVVKVPATEIATELGSQMAQILLPWEHLSKLNSLSQLNLLKNP
jgi:hypothetical protein